MIFLGGWLPLILRQGRYVLLLTYLPPLSNLERGRVMDTQLSVPRFSLLMFRERRDGGRGNWRRSRF